MSHNTKVLACINQKGGVGKSTTAVNLGIGLAQKGKKVLLIDLDPQGSLTVHLGYQQPEKIPITIAEILQKVINDVPLEPQEGVLGHAEGVDFIPANRNLTGMEAALIGAMSGETVLRQYMEQIRGGYDYILIDCLPSLGMIAVNALTAVDSLLIPVQPQYLDIKGLEELLRTFAKVRRRLNPALSIEGILLTMVSPRTNMTRTIIQSLQNAYAEQIRIFDTRIPIGVSAKEASSQGTSIFSYDSTGKVAKAYARLTEEVMGIA